MESEALAYGETYRETESKYKDRVRLKGRETHYASAAGAEGTDWLQHLRRFNLVRSGQTALPCRPAGQGYYNTDSGYPGRFCRKLIPDQIMV